MRNPRGSLRVVWASIALLASPMAWSQVAAPNPPPARAGVEAALPPAPTRASIEAKKADLAASEESPGDAVASALALYDQALASLQRLSDAGDRAAEARRRAEEAPALLESIRAELARPPAVTPTPPSMGTTLAQLEQELTQAKAELEAARAQVQELQTETTRRQTRRSEIPGQLADARQRLLEVTEALRTASASSDDGPLVEARLMELSARRAAAQAEVSALEAELTSYDARRDLLPARRDRAVRRVGDAERLVEFWQNQVAQRRQAEARSVEQDTRRLAQEAARRHPVLADFADRSAEVARAGVGRDGVVTRTNTAEAAANAARARLVELQRDFRSLDRRIEATGLNRATGVLVRRQYEALPEPSQLRRQTRATQEAIEEAEVALLERQDDRLEAGDIEGAVRSLMESIQQQGYEGDLQTLESVARDLAVARRDLLDAQVAAYQAYFQRLVELDTVQRRLLEATEAFRTFLRERVLWVRSVPGGRLPTAEQLRETVVWFIDPGAWVETGRGGLRSIRSHAPLASLLGLVLIGLFATRRRCKRELTSIAEAVGSYRTDSFGLTLRALALTLALAGAWPAALWVAGWLLGLPQDAPRVATALGEGLRASAVFLYPVLALRHALRNGGLGEAHFRWPRAAILSVRRNLRWFAPLGAVGVLLVIATERSGVEGAGSGVGRIAFTVAMLALALLLERTLRPKGPVVEALIARRPDGWLSRLRYIWYGFIVAGPVGLSVVAWLGYNFSAYELAFRLESSLLLALILVLLHALLLRWLFVARRRVAIEDARRRREQAMADGGARAAPTQTEAGPAVVDEDRVDLLGNTAQTRQLFRTGVFVAAVLGLYVIWADVLPAFRALDRLQVLPSVRVLEAEQSRVPEVLSIEAGETSSGAARATPGATGEPTPGAAMVPGAAMLSSEESPGGASSSADDSAARSVTMAEIGLGLLILIGTWVAFRNLPGPVEIMVLQRLPLDAGSRYALTTVLRYGIAIAGVAIAFNAIGLPWSQVQWLAAALTFGLAFGLQEIFANFVSGLIILAERPVRVGDTVTVGGVSGTVSRIRMRATTITDWERKELVIPNKSFITGDVINWTLSDPVLRLSVLVGVGYGEDIELAERTLLEVARANPTILDDPKPYVYFKEFGDSTLNFDLRVFIPHVEHLVGVRHWLHMEVTKAFRERGIEIAFPQRDLHVRSIGDLAGLVRRADGAGVSADGVTTAGGAPSAGAS